MFGALALVYPGACYIRGPRAFAGYVGLTVVFVWNSALRGKFHFGVGWGGGGAAGRCAIIQWGLDTFLIFSHFLRF